MKISVSFLGSKNIPDTLTKLNNTTVDYIHVDVMDKTLVKRKTLPFSEMKNIYHFTSKRLDVHLMVSDPKKLIHQYATLNTEFITIHLEINENINKLIEVIKSYGIKAGISIMTETDIEKIYPYLDKIDLVLIMGVKIGESGQEFDKRIIDKVKKLKEEIKRQKLKTLISVDGGINEIVAKDLSDVDILVSCSYVIQSDDYQDMINNLR